MTVEAFLMLVVAWCGVPTPYRLDNDQVNMCRAKAMACYMKSRDDTKVMACFQSIKLGG